MSSLKYFVNLGASSPLSGFLASAISQAPATPRDFVRSDQKEIELHFLDRPGQYTTEDPTSWLSTKFGVGEKDAPVNSGAWVFTDSDASESTGALSVSISAAALQVAIRAACTTNFGSCVITGPDGGPWNFDGGQAGDLTNPTADMSAVSPRGSVMVPTKTEDGDASLSPKWEIALCGPAAALTDSGWTALPAMAITPSVLVAGSGSQNKIFGVAWNADAIGGMVTLTFSGDTTAQGISWVYNATKEQILAAFEAHPDVEDNGVTVETQPGSGYAVIELTGAGINLSNTPTLTDTGASTLQVPVGLRGSIIYSRAGIIALLADGEPATATVEVEIRRDSGNTETFQSSCRLFKDLIRNVAGVSSSLQTFLTAAEIADDESVSVDASPASTAIESSQNRLLTNRSVAVGADASPYTHVLYLEVDPEPAIDGAMALIELAMPASTNPTIEIRNATSGGTLLYTAYGSGVATNRPLFFTYRASTGAWISRQGAS